MKAKVKVKGMLVHKTGMKGGDERPRQGTTNHSQVRMVNVIVNDSLETGE